MPIEIVDMVSNQAVLPRPVWLYDAAMNVIGALRAIGAAEDGGLGLVVDCYIKRKEKLEELRKWEERAFRVFRGGAGIKEIVQFFRTEMPELFDVRRMNFSASDPATDLVMGVGGMQANVLYDYDTGEIRMYYRVTPAGMTVLNARLGSMMATVKLLMERVREAERISNENKYLKARIGELEYSLSELQRFINERVNVLSTALTNAKAQNLEALSRYTEEELSLFVTRYKEGVIKLTESTKEFATQIAGVKKEFLTMEKEVAKAMNEIRDEILRLYKIPLTDQQVLELLRRVIIERPDWVAEQLRALREATGMAPPTGVP